jgi:hypothetical protein
MRKMALEPFKVGHSRPEFVIILFLGYDNELPSYLKDHHLNELARGAGASVAILAVADNALGPGQVVEITSRRITLLEDLGEIDTGDPQLLGDLLARALASYPSQPRIAIGFSGHGTGIFDEESPDQLLRALALLTHPRTHVRRPPRADAVLKCDYSVLHDRPHGQLTNLEVGDMLRAAFDAAGRRSPVDLLFFDTCLNGMIEVVTEFAEFAECVIASEENEPATGWHYDKWLARMNASPPIDPAAWGGQAVDAMAEAYAEISFATPVTLSAIAAGRGPLRTVACFKALIEAAELLGLDGYAKLEWARRRSRIFGDSKVDSYDLRDFAGHLAARGDTPTLARAAGALAEAVRDAVLHHTARDAPTAHGLAFWFPGTRQSFTRDSGNYRRLRFDRATGWSSYLDRYL